MAELNFGLLTPPGSQSIGNAFVSGMDQGQESRARDLQMQQATRKGQMDELAYKKALDTEARLNKYYGNIAANGGPKTALEAENAMIGSGVPHIADMGAKAQLLRLTNESDLALFNAANPKPGAPAAAAPAVAPMAPAVVPEPGSFGADVAERKAADPFASAPDTRTNMMDGAAPAATPANNLPAAVSGAARPNISEEVAAIQDQIDRNIRLGTPRAKAQVASLQTKLAALIKTTATGGSLFNSRGEVIATAPGAPTELNRLLAERAKLPPGDPRIAQYDARIGEITTAPGAHRGVMEKQGAQRLAVAQQRLAAETATGKFTPDTIDFVAEIYRQTGTMPNLGMGRAAADLRQKVIERAAVLARTPTAAAPGEAAPAPISAADAAKTVGLNKQAFAGGTAGQRTLGTTLANVTTAATEANNMIPLVEKYAALVDPTEFPLVNAAGNFVARHGGGENVVGLAGSLNSLVNAYARAINPKGVATVSDKNHAREIINTAMSKGQLATALSVMRAEMTSAMNAPKQVQEQMRSGTTAPAANPNRPSLDAIFGKKS